MEIKDSELLTLTEKLNTAKIRIKEMADQVLIDFKKETDFFITDISIGIIDISSRCGRDYKIGEVSLKITK